MQNDILMIDDDQDLIEIVEMYLVDKGFYFRKIYRGRFLDEEMEKKIPDLIILDIELPDRDGFDLCQQIRRYDENLPIIFLTNHHEENNRIQAFELGGDDFLSKPFSLEELRLRIITRLKDKHLLKQQTKFKFGNLILDISNETLSVLDQTIELTTTEMDIFRLLAAHPNVIYSEKEIYSQIWEEDYNKDTRMVNVHISNLRKKIDQISPAHKYIQTVWGKGYKYIG